MSAFELAARISRDSGFTITAHQSGYTGVRGDRGALLLFALAPSAACPMYWEMRSNQHLATKLADGFGLASLARFLSGAGLVLTETIASGHRRLAGPIITLLPHEYTVAAE